MIAAQLELVEAEGEPVAETKPRMVDAAALDGPEQVTIEVIYPALAEKYLRLYNQRNFRSMMRHHVENYEREIEEGNFTLSNAAIVLCTNPDNGKVFLGDGQHRLQACVNTGKPIRQMVLRGADPKIIMHADRGKGRLFGDYLAWMGYSHAKSLSMSLKILHTYKTNLDRISRPRATDNELYALVGNRPDLVRAVEWAAEHSLGRGKKPIRMVTSWLAVARTLILELSGTLKDEEARAKALVDADFFFARLVDHDLAELPGANHPIKQLLDVLIDHGNRSTDKYEDWKMMALVIKAWNRYRSGEHGTQTLKINLGGKFREAYPHPI